MGARPINILLSMSKTRPRQRHSFTLISIMMMRAERRMVFFMHRSEYEYVELLYPKRSLCQQ
eukprot:CCRYP_012318-RA/>CCRYP_012318-RA protein AED:0.41 eAED:0.41 QI:0/0/0/1/0/0/2/0/61